MGWSRGWIPAFAGMTIVGFAGMTMIGFAGMTIVGLAGITIDDIEVIELDESRDLLAPLALNCCRFRNSSSLLQLTFFKRVFDMAGDHRLVTLKQVSQLIE
ncbi:MAG: hypothetical protein JZU64_02040 [Rhodoferax sp.]|jgi:hypothetical protein|nr:hypothetical protein [Rhodoferax sp.]